MKRPARRAGLEIVGAPPAAPPALTPTEQQLAAALESFLAPPLQPFAVRDRVRWKPLMNNKGPTGPFVVVAVLAEPVFDEALHARQYGFREPLDLVIGYLVPPMNEKKEVIAGDPGFVTLHVDSRRFEPAD